MQSKKTTKNIAISGKWTWLVPLVSAILFAVVALWFLVGRNSDMLFMVQSKSIYTSGGEFFGRCMSQPGGLIVWIGSWLTQLFYYPTLGAMVLVGLWIITFFVLKYAFRISNVFSPILLLPFILLLSMDIHMGYWIYFIKQPAFFFRESLGILSVAILVLSAKRWEKENFTIGTIHTSLVCLVAGASYALTGFYSIVALLCIALMNISPKSHLEGEKPIQKWICIGIAIATLIVAPLAWGNVFTAIPSGNVFTAGFPSFVSTVTTESQHAYPLIAAIVALAVFCFLPYVNEITGKRVYGTFVAYALLLAGTFVYLDKMNFDNENFHAECEAYRAVDEQRWNDVLYTVGNVEGHITRELIVLKNIALFNTGDAGNSMYHYDDLGIEPYTGDSLHVVMNNIASPMIFMHHGMLNFAYRWAMENSVEFGFSFDSMKTLTLVSLLMGEYDVAEKYLNILSKSMFYKEWADRYRPILSNHKLISNYEELKNIRELNAHMGNRIDSDGGIGEKFIMHYFAGTQNKDSKYLQEMTLAYAMMSKDIQNFWPKYLLYLYLHKGEKVPTHYQEAAYMYGMLEPQTAPNPQQYGISFDQNTIINRYNEFQRVTQGYLQTGMTEETIAEATKSQFGDTFWWVYFFNRNSHYY